MTMIYVDPSNIKAIECKHVAYQKALDNSGDDILIVKEVVHTKDNKLIPRTRDIINFQREFYITRPDKRNHLQKKEEEDIENCIEYKCTQANMCEMIQRALGSRTPNPGKNIHDVCSSPYVYMADITTPTLLKAKYKAKWPDAVSNNKVAVLDIETNMLGTDEERNNPILITVTCGNEKLVGILNSYRAKIPNCVETIDRMYTEQLSSVPIKDKDGKFQTHNLVEERGKTITYFFDDKPGALFAQIMIRVHEMMPDFVAIWNMNFDLPKLIKCLTNEGFDPAQVFSDPNIPERFKFARYIEANAKKVTNSKTISKHPADLWHVMDCPCSFYWVDAMVLFKNIRTANGNEPSYSLDSVLKKYLGVGKLKFKAIDGEGTARWHITMQRDYPAEYVVYNIFDCVSVELLDDKTKDIQSTISALIDISELKIFPSLPKRLVDILTFFYKDKGKVPGSCGSVDTSGIDDHIISLSGWIVTLPAYMVVMDGLNCIEECPEIVTMFRTQTADDDLAQAYPTGEVSQNISKDTTAIEVLGIEGVSEAARRRAGINLTGGKTNAIECANDILNLPYIHDVLDAFIKDIELEDMEDDDSAASGN